jgi:hypothetical protein
MRRMWAKKTLLRARRGDAEECSRPLVIVVA